MGKYLYRQIRVDKPKIVAIIILPTRNSLIG